MRKLNHSVFRVFITLLAASNIGFGWGRTGHQIINGNFTRFLPPELRSLTGRNSYYILHASDADSRKGSAYPSEAQRHFIDIDAYPTFASGTLSHDYDSLVATYGISTVNHNGTLPWAISSTYDALVVSFENGDQVQADSIIADLGHYVGDAFQPLHCTQNYDGRMTGNDGIHSRFETHLLDDYASSVKIEPLQVAKIDTSALEFAFRIIGESNALVSEILSADSSAKKSDPQYGSEYYAAMWEKLDTLLNGQLQKASDAVAALVYSAWLDAGSPGFTAIFPHAVPSAFEVSEAYPNPFNPTTRFDVVLPANSPRSTAALSVYAPDGRLVRSARRSLISGTNSVTIDLNGASSGVYIVSLLVSTPAREERHSLKVVLLK